MRKLIAALKRLPPLSMLWREPSFRIGRPFLIDNADCIEVGKRVQIREYAWLSAITAYAGQDYVPKIVFGEGVYAGRFLCLTCISRVEIGANSVLSEHVYIADSGHGIDPTDGRIMDQRLQTKGPVRIGRSCFVGYGARILSGVELGDHCVVGANSVVTRSFPAYTMVAGSPARRIKFYDITTEQWINVDE